MMARLRLEDGVGDSGHRSPPFASGLRGSCCCCGVGVCGGVTGGGLDNGDRCTSTGRPPMERWCMRRRRRKRSLAEEGLSSSAPEVPPPSPGSCGERCLDYQRNQGGGSYSCDDDVSNSCDNSIFSLLRSRIASLPDRLPHPRICGERGPSGGESGGERGVGRKDDCTPSNLFLSAPCSSGRGGDGAAVHFPASGLFEASDCDAQGSWCGGRRVPLGGRCRGVVPPPMTLVSLLWVLLGAVIIGGASASIMGDGCDWSGSGLMAEMEESREGGGVGVRPVYLRCSQGAVSWAYPRGALRVLLRLAGGRPDEEFRGCVRLGRTWKGARLFLEGVRSLHPLFPGVEDGVGEGPKGTGVRCFQSRKGQAALYVEATPGGVSPRGRTVASFEYHLQPLPSGVKSFDPSEECRPCTMEEMTHAFCSSDLVTRGTIRSVENRDDPTTSELKVRVTKLIRRTRAPPPALEGDPSDEEDELHEEGGEPRPRRGHWWDSTAGDRGASVTLHLPTHCDARLGAGEFVFMAQRKLGQLRLKCAPRLEDWAELARKSNRLAASPCVLQA